MTHLKDLTNGIDWTNLTYSTDLKTLSMHLKYIRNLTN